MAQRNLSWLDEIDIKSHLDFNYSTMYEICGKEKFLLLLEAFNKTQIYFSNFPIIEMKKEFIKKNKEKYSTSDLARKLNCSLGFVYKVVRSVS